MIEEFVKYLTNTWWNIFHNIIHTFTRGTTGRICGKNAIIPFDKRMQPRMHFASLQLRKRTRDHGKTELVTPFVRVCRSIVLFCLQRNKSYDSSQLRVRVTLYIRRYDAIQCKTVASGCSRRTRRLLNEHFRCQGVPEDAHYRRGLRFAVKR